MLRETSRIIGLDATGWLVVAILLTFFFVGYLLTRRLAPAMGSLKWLSGRIATVAPNEFIRKYAWRMVQRLHEYDARRILTLSATRHSGDSPAAAAWLLSQSGTPLSTEILVSAEGDPSLSDQRQILDRAVEESVKVEASLKARAQAE